MSKSDRIKILEREVDQLHTVMARLSDRVAVLERAARVVPPSPSLVGRARARAVELGDRVLRAVGL